MSSFDLLERRGVGNNEADFCVSLKAAFSFLLLCSCFCSLAVRYPTILLRDYRLEL